MRRIFTILFTIISLSVLGVSVHGDMMISENDTLYVEEINLDYSGSTLTNDGTIYVKKRIRLGAYCTRLINNGIIVVDTNSEIFLGAGATFTNDGVLIFKGNFFPHMVESDTAFVNNGYIECNNFKYELVNANQFIQNGYFKCHNDLDYRVSSDKYQPSFGDSASTVARNVNIRIDCSKYDIELGGNWRCENMSITSEDSHFGEDEDTINLQFNGRSHIEQITGNTHYATVNVNVVGFLAVGNVGSKITILVSSGGMISLCYNPTYKKDYKILNEGIIFYRVRCGNKESYYWPEIVRCPEEVEIKDGYMARVIPYQVSYDECINNIPTIYADFAIEGGMVYSAGVITVYNVAGQVVATASQEFNVNILAAGAYFIVAEEGTIKFVK